MTGRIALVGSGEFTAATERVDQALLDGVAQRVVFLPTAAAQEGSERLSYWVELGRAYYARLGVEALPLLVLDRQDADSEELAAQVPGAGLVYLSGGDPTYLASTLVGTRVGAAIVDAWRRGASVAGCSAGAIALMEVVPDIRQGRREPVGGLGLVTAMRVIPHFDRLEQWMPGAIQRAIDTTPSGVHLIGVDEDTAMVGGSREWRVMGRGSAWILNASGEPLRYDDGDILTTATLPG